MIDLTKKTDFECVSEDIYKIATRILENKKLSKLIFYNEEDALKRPDLTEEQKQELFEKLISTIPHVPSLEEQKTAIMILFDGFSPNATNPHYMDCVLQFDILCHKELWKVNDARNATALRPYMIAHELFSMFHEKKLTGIGNTQFINGELLILGADAEYSGISLSFSCINPGA